MSGKIWLVIISTAAQERAIFQVILGSRIRLPVISTLHQALLASMPAQAMVHRSSILMETVVTTTRTPSRIPEGTYTYYDMGAYEYFPVCKGDFDKDGDVDGSDLAVFAVAFGSSSDGPDYNPVADFDGDGFVDESDLAAFAAAFGRTDCPICP